MLLKGQHADRIHYGNSFTQDGLAGERFHYFLANPPFGVHWGQFQEAVQAEHEQRGFEGRFGAGTPRVNDGSLLFLQHMIAKWHDPDGEEGGSRLVIVFNGSPLFTGAAGSGESEIRLWLDERAFQNLAKSRKRDAVKKRAEERAGRERQRAVLDALTALAERHGDRVWRDRAAFRKIVEPALEADGVKPTAALRKALWSALGEPNPEAEICRDRKGNPEPDTDLRDTEQVPLGEAIEDYFDREVAPTCPTPGSTRTRRPSGTRSTSTATSTPTSRPGPWTRSRRTSRRWKVRSCGCWGRWFDEPHCVRRTNTLVSDTAALLRATQP